MMQAATACCIITINLKEKKIHVLSILNLATRPFELREKILANLISLKNKVNKVTSRIK